MLNQTTLSTTIKNRTEFLKQTLPTWLKQDFKNIYILNWASNDTDVLIDWIKSINDNRIILETITGQGTEWFIGSTSRNIACERALELTKPEYLFQIDSDIIINPSISDLKLQKDKMYVHPSSYFLKFSLPLNVKYGDDELKDRNDFGAFGSVLMPAEYVFKYGHYDEKYTENNMFDAIYLKNYYDNELGNIWMFRDEIEHIPHSNELRAANSKLGSLLESTWHSRSMYEYPELMVPRRTYKRVVNGLVLESAAEQNSTALG